MPVRESKTGMGGAWELPPTVVQMWQKEVLDRSTVLQGCLSARLMGRGGGVLELKSPFRGKWFLTELGLFHIPAGSLWEVWSLCKGDGEFRMHSPGLPSLKSWPKETWEAYLWLPQLAHRKTWNNEKVGSYRKIAISLSYISRAFKNIRVQKGQDGIEASLITSLKIQWEKKIEGWSQLITSHQTSHRKCIPWRNK